MNSPRRSGVPAVPLAGVHHAGQDDRLNGTIDPDGISQREANWSTPVLLNPTTACHAGAVYPAVFHRRVERGTQFLFP